MPSDAELDVLKTFWRHGGQSSREVQARIAAALNWNPSTTRTVLERMRSKGLLARREVHGVAVYEACQLKVEVLGGMMRRLSSMLEMEGPLPVSAFTGSQLLDAEDIAALEAVLAAGEGAD